jgi:hypothetical protein
MDKEPTEALVADVEIPEINTKVVRRDIGLAIRVDRDRVDMVGMGIRIDLSWYCCHDGVMVSQSR